MSDFDSFAIELLEEAKRFLERAVAESGEAAERPFLHAALLMSFSALESHVNALAQELELWPASGLPKKPFFWRGAGPQ